MALTDAELQELIDLGATDEEILALEAESSSPKASPQSPEFKQKVFEQTLADRERYSPLSDMNPIERALAGAGKSVADLASGTRQLWNRATGDAEELSKLQADAAEERDLSAPLMDTTAGTVGNVAGHIAQMAIPGAQIAKAAQAAKLGLPAIAAAEGALGAGTAALAPTTREGEIGENIAWGGGIGVAIPAGGAAVRSLVGKVDPARQAAAQRLRDLGIDIQKVQEYPGYVSDAAGAALRRMPLVGNAMVERDVAQQALARKALFDLLGESVPTTSTELADLTGRLGANVGRVVPEGQALPVEGLADDVADILAKEVDPSPDVIRAAKDLTQRATPKTVEAPQPTVDDYLRGITPAAPPSPPPTMLGSEYAQIRSNLGADISAAKGRDKATLKKLQKALDERTARGKSAEQLAAEADARSKYHLIKALNKQVIDPGKGFDLRAAQRDISRAGQKSRFPREATQLLDDVSLILPPKGASSDTVRGVATGLAVTNPVAAAAIASATGIPYALLNTGIPQNLANNQAARAALTAALRGKTQSELRQE